MRPRAAPIFLLAPRTLGLLTLPVMVLVLVLKVLLLALPLRLANAWALGRLRPRLVKAAWPAFGWRGAATAGTKVWRPSS